MQRIQDFPPVRIARVEVRRQEYRRVRHDDIDDKERHPHRRGSADHAQLRLRLETADDARHGADPPRDRDGKDRAGGDCVTPERALRRRGRDLSDRESDRRGDDIGEH